MAKIRESIVSICEKKFVQKCLDEYNRLDGRSFDEFRDVTIEFGKDWGCCYVSLGQTQVIAQVSCEVQVPKSTRPSEGILYINVELNPLAAAHFEPGRQSELSVQLNRLLEKFIKDSKAVDLESLCIKVNEKVWCLRVDVNVLNYEGNIIDCASIAALAALAHFRRPDVTCDGEEIVVHTYAQRDFIPTVIYHYPVCVSFAIFSDGETILADPNLLEENVAEACIMIGLNAYKELCGFHLGGSSLMTPEIILRTINKAANRASVVIKKIKAAVEEDNKKREENTQVGFQESRHLNIETSAAREDLSQCLDRWMVKAKSKKNVHQKVSVEEVSTAVVEPLGEQSAVLFPADTKANPWHDEDSHEEADSDVEIVESKGKSVIEINDSDGSEEENVVVLNADRKTNKRKKKNKHLI